jgi:fermentation-respiration switch protein FrsA (DUF1100 family)
MDKQEYLTGIGELYAAEVLGEGLANRWLELTTDPFQKYKLGLFLQLESEAKVRLRPLLARHGVSPPQISAAIPKHRVRIQPCDQ